MTGRFFDSRPRVLLSALRLGDGAPDRRTGNFYHVFYLVQALARRHDVDLTVLADESSYDAMAELLPAGRLHRASVRGNVVGRDLAIASTVYRLRPDVYHKPTGALPTLPLPCPTIAGIADLNFVALPTRPDKRLYKELTHRWTSRRATHIVCVSEYTRQEVLSYLNPDPARVSVIPHGTNELAGGDDGMAARMELDLGRYWLAFAHHAHKNVETLLQAAAYRAFAGTGELPLVIVGDGPYVDDVLRPMVEALNLGATVRFPGRVTSGTLRGLYQRASGLLFPSQYEGFGLPVLEAMALGCPVVCSNVCSLPEVAGDAAALMAPTDIRALLDAVRRLESGARHDQIRRGRLRAASFTWERAADATAQLYRSVGQQARGVAS